MKLADNIFPSFFAKVLAHEAGLLEDVHAFNHSWTWGNEEILHLIEFQQLSLVTNFDNCLTVYFGIDLSEKQINNLRTIYENTPPLMPGNLFMTAMKSVASESNKSKPNMQAIISNFHVALDKLGKKQRAIP